MSAQAVDEIEPPMNKPIDSRPAEKQEYVLSRTDKYFSKSRQIIEKFGDRAVTYGVFMRRGVICAVNPAIEMLRHQGCDNAWGVVTEWCGFLGLFGNRTVQGVEDLGHTFDLPVRGDDACIGSGSHTEFQAYADSRGTRGNGFPQSVYSVGISNGSFSPQGCANIDDALPCPGEPLAWASGTGPGSITFVCALTRKVVAVVPVGGNAAGLGTAAPRGKLPSPSACQ